MDKMGTAFVKTKANEVIEQAAGTAKQKVSTLIGGNKDKGKDAAKQPEPAGKKAENAMGKALDFGKNLLG